MENCQPSKTNINLDFASVDIGFLGVTLFPMLPSRAVNIDKIVVDYIYIDYAAIDSIKYLNELHI